ncbi:hypothetical protein LCGC14_1965950 [marine sediment metagenome]|uniref:Uncharacterized protein n=1 Tax=marine sediment metagenome TaxID=412755 RepID=A0A0F9IA92_9ZZZZ
MVDTVVDLTQRAIIKDMEILQRVFEVDFVPLLKQKQKLERKAFDAAYEEVTELEEAI